MTSIVVVGFVALAVARLLLLEQERFVRTSVDDQRVAQLMAYAVASIIPLLVPVAVAVRNPNAWVSNRMLLLGAAVLAIGISLGALIRLGAPAILAAYAIAGGAPALLFVALAAAISLAEPLGVLLMTRGLKRARRCPDPPGRRWVAPVVALAAVFTVGVVISSLRVVQVASSSDPLVLINLASGFVISAATIGAWTFFTITAIGGLRAGEHRRVGWLLGGLAGLAGIGLSDLLFPVVADAYQLTDLASVSVVTTVVAAPPVVLLFLAFSAGLPRAPAVAGLPTPGPGAASSPGSAGS